MPRFVLKPNEGLAGRPIVRRGRLLGTLRRPDYKRMRRQAQARRLARKAAKVAKRSKWAADRNDWNLQREAEANAATWRKRAKRLNPPRRRGPVRTPKRQAELPTIQLMRAQGIAKRWLSLITMMVREKWLVLKPTLDLRKAVADAIRPYNPEAAKAFKAGEMLYLPPGNLPLISLLRFAETKPSRPVSSALLKAQAKKRRTREHLSKARGW